MQHDTISSDRIFVVVVELVCVMGHGVLSSGRVLPDVSKDPQDQAVQGDMRIIC
jgi:hypothetical protein